MVVSRSDTKRRQKDGESGLPESPKRTKVHAQRKFAQGSNLNTPTLTPVKEKDKNKVNGAVVSTELLPAKRPNTEDFLTFLCFRGTQKLPQRLDFFNIATTPEQQDDDSKTDHSVAGSSRVSARCIEKSFSEQSFAVAKAETKARNKPRPTAAVQAFKKKYQEQRLAKQKISLTKLAQKVKGKNMVRTRSAALLEENRRVPKTVPQRSVTVVPAVKAKATPKPVVKQTIKRLNPKQVNSSLRGGLRSGGELPPGSDIGLKSERKPRLVVKDQEPPNPRTQKRFKVKAKKTIASSLSDFSSDDDQPLVKKQRVNLRRQRLQLNTSMSTRSIRLERLRRHRNETSKNSVRSRPTRKTKEAAALFLEEMIGKDLRSPDEDSDYIDETFSDKSFTESPKKTERKEKETKCILEKNKSLSKDNTKKDNDPEIIPTKKKKEEDKKLLKKTVVKLNMIKEKDTKSVKKLSTNKDVENKPTTSKTINEDKVIEQPTRKGELKGKTFVNKADRRHSLPEAPKIMLEKRSTRQRPGNLSLDNSPTRLKTQLNDTDDKFSDSDEEPLGNISSKKSTKQIGAKKGLPEKNVSPVVRKETPKVSGKKNEIKKLKNTEKHGKSEDIKNKPVKKDSVRKSVSEEVVDIEQKFQSVTQNETRSKFRNNKSSKDLDSDVKSLIGNKGNVGTAETKDNILKKTEGNSKSGNAKGNLEKPKLKKGWVICSDIEEPSSNETFSQRKGTKTASNIKESILKKEIDQKASTEEKIIKNDETESVTVAPETPSKKCSKKNKVTSLLPESSVVDKSLQKSNAKSESDLNTSKNKTKQTNKKSNEMIAVENTLLAENVSKNVLKTNTKGNTNSIRNSTEKSSTKIIPENSVIANSPSASVESAKKNIKNKVSISDSEKDTSLQTNKSNKNVDVKVVCESAKSSSISNLKMCTSEIKETTVLDIDGSVSKEISGKDNCIVNKQIEGSVIKTNVNEKVDEDCSDKDISDCKSNKNVMKKTNKANLNKTSNLGSQEIKIQKNKNSSQKVNEKMESTSISTQEENIVKANENTGARCKNKSFEKNKFLVNEHHSENLDAKNKEKTLLATESPQSFITQEAKKTCSEADKNKSIVNTDNSICTETTGGLCTKNVVEENKSSTKQRISDKDINSLKQVDNVSAIKQNTSDQKY